MPQNTSTAQSNQLLAILKPRGPDKVVKCNPNILPCRIHHDGPVKTCSRYWRPMRAADGTRTAYFRGRKLMARAISVPDGCRGAVVKKTDQLLKMPEARPDMQNDDDSLGEEAEPDEARLVEEVAEFDEVVIWGHETPPEDSENPYVRGIEEWIAFANALHSSAPHGR